jgi:pyrroline-5-carboxylate reductase
MNISFIGGGNMASALIGGLLKDPGAPSIRVADPSTEARERLAALPGVTVHADGAEVIEGADMVVLALKPQLLPGVLKHLGPLVHEDQCVLSVAAGITIAQLRATLHGGVAVIRTMPNTPALLGLGITGLFADPACSRSQKDAADRVMRAVGETVWVESESQIDAVTAISGSGPAYFYLLTEALAEAGEALGLSAVTAGKLATQTAIGAGAMLAEDDSDAATLRRRVTSPGGTTAAAIAAFEDGALRTLVANATRAAAQRSRELANAGADS